MIISSKQFILQMKLKDKQFQVEMCNVGLLESLHFHLTRMIDEVVSKKKKPPTSNGVEQS